MTAARQGPAIPLAAAHAAAIWAFAVAQPLYDVLRRNPEFFIAHRAGLADLLCFTLLVSVALPVALAALWLAPTRWWPSARLGTAAALVGVLVAMLGSQLLAHRVPLPTAVHALIACAAGLAAAWAYRARPGFRSLLTAATPAIVAFPAIFLLHPSMATFVRTETRDEQAAAEVGHEAPPIVFLVFDQLPVTSLMDSRGGIDRARYPGFAALADTATWYRNATTVADYTGWALPPILTGLRPTPEKRPTSQSYPFNLFTWLGDAYHVEGIEPITQLCPERLCDARDGTRLGRVLGMLVDSSVVYLATALPEGPRQWLPPLTNDWRNFIDAQRWQRRWITERNNDRRQPPRDLIAGISRDDPAPTLYFAHTLLPHEPYVYLRSGQTFTTAPGTMIGMRQRGLWSPDPWPATLAYQRHLLQLEFVDAIIEQLLKKLEDEGLLERALIVVTSDHGVSFRADRPFKGLRHDTLTDMMSVPLFIKAPGQRRGVVSDRNVQSVDVMPTIASILGVPLTWKADGLDAGASASPGDKKLMHHTAATKSIELDAAWLAAERDKAVARKVSLFGEDAGWRAPAPGARDLLGQRVADLEVRDGELMALVDSPQKFRQVSLDAADLPLTISGRLRDGDGRPASGELAVAVGDRIVALTRTFHPDDAPRDSWRAVIDPAALRPGRNIVEVFVVPPEPGGPLGRAFSSGQRPDTLNLASRGAADYFEVAQEGLLPREGSPIPFRWTTGDARLTVPLGEAAPQSLRIGLLATRPGGSEVSISYDGCELFAGTVTAPWYRVFPLAGCAGARPAETATIAIRTTAWEEPERKRSVGVGVETVNLFAHGWPPPDEPSGEHAGTIRLVDPDAPRTPGSTVKVELGNLGTRTWLPASEAPAPERAIALAIRWRVKSRSGTTAEQRMQLPRALYPTDRAVIEAPLVPPPALASSGPWEVTIAPVDEDGALVADDLRVTFPVEAAPPAGG